MSSYVQQADIFMGAVTVREHLIFSARLRMGRRFSDAEKIARVDQVISKFYVCLERTTNGISCKTLFS